MNSIREWWGSWLVVREWQEAYELGRSCIEFRPTLLGVEALLSQPGTLTYQTKKLVFWDSNEVTLFLYGYRSRRN